MIMYAFFIAMTFIGCSMFIYGMMMEYQFYITIATTFNLNGLVVPIGFYILIGAGMFFIATPLVMMMRIRMSGAGKRFDGTPHNKGLFDFIYRDGDIRDVYGDRIPGLGLFRIFKLGLIFDAGREPKPGSVYNIPGKKVRFALQDINFTPNPKFAGFYTYLNDLGFNNMTEVNDVLNGYSPELMVKIWDKMCLQVDRRPEDVIVERLQTLSPRDIEKNNRLWEHQVKHRKNKRGTHPIAPWSIIRKSMEKSEGEESGKEDDIHG